MFDKQKTSRELGSALLTEVYSTDVYNLVLIGYHLNRIILNIVILGGS